MRALATLFFTCALLPAPARAVVRAAIIAEGRVPPSGQGIIQFTETYDVGPLPIK